MKFTTLCLTFCLLLPCFAAPHEVSITLQKADGQPLEVSPDFALAGPENLFKTGKLESGKATTLSLEPGYYSLYLWPGVSTLPAKVWHGLAVSSEAKDVIKWDLKVPIAAAIQGRLMLPDGKPAMDCLVVVQSGTRKALAEVENKTANTTQPELNSLTWESWAKNAFGSQHAYWFAITDAAGNFTLKNLVPANYVLDVYEPTSKKWFTIPFAPALKTDAEKGEPTKLGAWTVPENGWDWLFDAAPKHGGAASKYIGQGKVTIENGVLRLGVGDDMTGLNWPDYDKEKLPRQNYEISFDARRVEGTDFFTGLTFPYGDKPISWIVGGWGGTVVGLSNINGFAAVENETTKTMEFADERWYRLRLRVSKMKIEAWIDEEKVINLPTMDKEFTIRWSVEPSLPLGFATWKTGGELRDIRLRSLEKDELEAIEKSLQE